MAIAALQGSSEQAEGNVAMTESLPDLRWPPPPGARRVTESAWSVLAPNPSGWTYEGTNTWLIGVAGSDCVIVDPASAAPVHQGAILDWISSGSRRPKMIVLTHSHPDHTEGSSELAEVLDIPIASANPDISDIVLDDETLLKYAGVDMRVLHTPGHTADSISLILEADRSVLTGDTIFGERSTAVLGSLRELITSLERLRLATSHQRFTLLPGHGRPGADASARMHRVLIHRLERVGDVRDALAVGDQNLVDLVRLIYPHVEETMHRAAGRTVLAGIEYLAEDGAVSASALERFRRQMIDLGVKNDA